MKQIDRQKAIEICRTHLERDGICNIVRTEIKRFRPLLFLGPTAWVVFFTLEDTREVFVTFMDSFPSDIYSDFLRPKKQS